MDVAVHTVADSTRALPADVRTTLALFARSADEAVCIHTSPLQTNVVIMTTKNEKKN